MNNKIIYLSNSIIPSRSANSVHVMKMCQAFKNVGKDVQLICYTRSRSIDLEEMYEEYGVSNKFMIHFLYVRNKRGMFFQKILSIVNLLNKQARDIVVYGRSLYGIYLASLLGFTVYYESHGLPYSKAHEIIEKLLFGSKKLKKIIVISEKLRQMYLENHPDINSSRINVLHDGADLIKPHTKKADLGNGFHIGYMGTMNFNGRGIDLLLKVAKNNKDLTFHLIGGKTSELTYWKKLATDNVIFYGYLPNSETSEYLLSFDVVLMPYQADLKLDGMDYNTITWMSPMKMFEYMSSNSGIVSSDFPVIREVLSERNSILVKADDEKAWSEAIRYLYQNSHFLKEISSNALSEFSEKYTWAKRAESLNLQ